MTDTGPTVPVPPIIDRETFDAVQALLKARKPKATPARVISSPTPLPASPIAEGVGE